MGETQSKTSQLRDYLLVLFVVLSFLLVIADVATKALDDTQSEDNVVVTLTPETDNE